MDKRSFFFVFLLSITFLVVNTYFISPSTKQGVKEISYSNEELASRRANSEELGLKKIFFDPEGSEFASYGVESGDVVATIALKNPPAHLYFEGKKVFLLNKGGENQPLFYGFSKESKWQPRVSSDGRYDVQLVTGFDQESGVRIALGELDDLRLHFLDEAKEGNALAFRKGSDHLELVGFWSSEEKKFVAFTEDPRYIPILTEDRASPNTQEEILYVLENNYQQLVFSTKGGALKEINLSFDTQNNPNNTVKPISFDTEIAKSSPQNNLFPLMNYKTFEGGKVVDKTPKQGGYMPLLRRNIEQNAEGVSTRIHPQYYALTLVTEAVVSKIPDYKMTNIGKDFIEFTAKLPEKNIIKTYRFVERSPYTLSLEMSINGDTKNLWLTSGVPEVELVSGSSSPVLRYLSNGPKESVEKISLPKNELITQPANPVWVSNSNGFFGVIINPLHEINHVQTDRVLGTEIPTRLTLIDADHNLYPAKDYPGYETMVPVNIGSAPVTYRIFAGPYDAEILKQVDAAAVVNPSDANPHFELAIAFQGWFTFISEPFAKFLYIIMQFFYMVTGSWGISIILLTLVLRLILFPLNSWSFKSNAKLQKLGPKLKLLQEKFKKDPKRLQTETAMLYKTEGVNPLSGCLPILVQIPFFIAMFDLLKSTFALRGVSFIPGWINNLTAPDVLFSWGYPFPFIGNSFHLLPILLSGLMFLQQKMNAAQQDKKAVLTDQQKQMQSMGTIMTVAFLFIFYNMPSGLNIYFIFSTLFGMIQQYFIMSRFNKQICIE